MQHEKVNNNDYQTYFESDCFLVIGVRLEHNIDSFKPLNADEKEKSPEKEKLPEKKDVKKPGKDAPKEKAKVVEVHEEEPKTLDIYERCVFICPYKDGEFVVKLLNAFYTHNRDVFNI